MRSTWEGERRHFDRGVANQPVLSVHPLPASFSFSRRALPSVRPSFFPRSFGRCDVFFPVLAATGLLAPGWSLRFRTCPTWEGERERESRSSHRGFRLACRVPYSGDRHDYRSRETNNLHNGVMVFRVSRVAQEHHLAANLQVRGDLFGDFRRRRTNGFTQSKSDLRTAGELCWSHILQPFVGLVALFLSRRLSLVASGVPQRSVGLLFLKENPQHVTPQEDRQTYFSGIPPEASPLF